MEWITGIVGYWNGGMENFITSVQFGPQYYKAKYTESILIDKNCVGKVRLAESKTIDNVVHLYLQLAQQLAYIRLAVPKFSYMYTYTTAELVHVSALTVNISVLTVNTCTHNFASVTCILL